MQSKRDKKLLKIKIDDPIGTLKSESFYNCRLNMLESNFEFLTIQFGNPNGLSLNYTFK